jgi:hypothetical protein
VHGGGERLVTAGGSERDETASASDPRRLEDALELADLVAAVNLAREIVALDPELALGRRKAGQKLDGGRVRTDHMATIATCD